MAETEQVEDFIQRKQVALVQVAGGYPAARNWSVVEQVVVGADHENGGGGYSGGISQECSDNMISSNGNYLNKPDYFSGMCNGGAYFSEHRYDDGYNRKEGSGWEQGIVTRVLYPIGGSIGGQGGGYVAVDGAPNVQSENFDSGGDGGIAGKGGIIKVSRNVELNAFNGNLITDSKYDYDNEILCNYDKDGKKLESDILTYIERKDGKKIIPVRIFAQEGILRNVYKSNSWWKDGDNIYKKGYSYDEFFTIFGSTINPEVKDIKVANKTEELKSVCVRKEQSCNTTSYINPVTNNNQGIGSGAGYIELDNGIFEEIE